MIKDQQIKGDSFFHKMPDCRNWVGLQEGRQHRREAAELPQGNRGERKGLLLLVAQVTPTHGRVCGIVFYSENYIQQSHLLVQTKQQKGFWGEEVLAKCPPSHFSGSSRGKDKLSQPDCNVWELGLMCVALSRR